MNSAYRQSYDILNKIYREGTYSNLLMNQVDNPRVAKLVFGVMDKHYYLNYIIDNLTEKTKQSIRIILFLNIYSLEFLDTPANVVINESNELATALGKSGVIAFLNAIIRKVADKKYTMPSPRDKNYNEVKYNLPNWLVGMFKKDYPDNFEDIIFAQKYNRVHIRPNVGTEEDTIRKADPTLEKSLTGYFVKNNKEISMLNYLGEITYQSYPSSLIAYAVPLVKGDKVLDVCAAPGGKSVYLRQRGGEVISCDIHEHRVKLIDAYAKRMGVKLSTAVADATVFNSEWEQKFDVVLADVPCSGLGVIANKRDIIFGKSYDDIVALSILQGQILENVKRYVKPNGYLVYSTCTVFGKENKDITDAFLANNKDFSMQKIDLPYPNEGSIQFLPDGKGMEGFYLCLMKKN